MFHKNKVITRFTLNGFTINPVTEQHILVNIMRGLAEYNGNHLCDYSKGVVHKNYLGNIVLGPIAATIENVENTGLVGHCILDNGYYTIRIWNNTHPSKFQFDLFLEDDLKDPDLIIDHLCAPPVPNDGFGIFDYTYSTKRTKLSESPLTKHVDDESQYLVNDKIKFIDNEKNNWNITLNQLKEIECYYCKENATDWVFIDDMSKVHIDFKSILVCKEHIKNGRTRELSSSLANESGLDKYSSDNERSFSMNEIRDESGKVLYTQNQEIIKLGEE
jgi:hypothetical protein